MARPGPREILWAAEGDKNYAYGPSRAQRESMAAHAGPGATIQLLPGTLFDHPQASAAFVAAANVWAHTIVSPSTIRVSARFEDMGSPNILGSAGPTAICGILDSEDVETWYAAALADKLVGSQSCADLADETSEITVIFNSTFDWDFGTSGTPVPGKINFMTVVLHELGHGLGFYGSASASSLAGDFGNPCSDLNNDGTFIGCYLDPPDIYDRFIVTGSATPLLDFLSPSADLATLLVGNNLYFSGTQTRSGNGGQNAKIEAHHFNMFFFVPEADHGWLEGSSYSHLDDELYTATPNGLMTWQLNRAEVYTDPGPILRGMFRDIGWTVTADPPPPACAPVLTPTSFDSLAAATNSSVSVSVAAGCAWTATSNSTFLTVTGGASGTGNGLVTFHVATNTSSAPRTGVLVIAGQIFTVSQAGLAVGSDFDGDGAADLVLFRPGNGDWKMRLSSQGFATGVDLAFGLSTDKPVPGDYDGDGRMDMALYRPSNGIWYVIYSSTGALAQLQWGVATDIPMPADYTGDGRTDLCIWRPATGEWFIFDLSSGTYTSRQWGVSTDIPLTGDYDGDGLADVAVFRPSNGYWFVFFSSTQTYTVYQWGVSTDVPVPADYTGDGRIDIAVYRPSNGYWFVYDLSTGTYNTYQWGVSTDIPAPKDYDGDGRTDLAIWRPSTGEWFLYYLGSSTFQAVVHGANGDVPVK
jgi:hypothetical protein